MTDIPKLYLHIAVDEVGLVIRDPQGGYNADRYDRYATFTEARDAALTCIEAMFEEGDYEDEAHRRELEAMQRLLEAADTLEVLVSRPGYRWFLDRLGPTPAVAA